LRKFKELRSLEKGFVIIATPIFIMMIMGLALGELLSVERKPFRSAPHRNALSWWNHGDNDRAIANFDKAFEVDPKFVQAYGDRDLAYEKKGDHDRAIADFDKAISLDSKYAPPTTAATPVTRRRANSTAALPT
jgi:tetratricopeptide (TPR) repeat protein